MLGQFVKHPKSTNFEDDFPTPIAKRLKREPSVDYSPRDGTDYEEENQYIRNPKWARSEVPDSEDEDDEDGLPPRSSQTELESALPPISTDKEAISAYEAARAAEDSWVLDLRGRLGQQKWIQGKSSIYVDAFNLALETVLDDEGHLFDEAEKGVFECWRALGYEAQYL